MGVILAVPCIIAAWVITIVALKNRKGGAFLCDDCIYNNDESCHRAERPRALACTTYRSEKQVDYRM